MSKQSKTPKLEDILIDDDASKYLESLPDDKRWPQYGLNGLPRQEGAPLTAEEREALHAIWLPNQD